MKPTYTERQENDCGKRALVAYATRMGSTTGIAEAIGRTLAAQGVRVDVRAIQDVDDLKPYSAVVLGSAIQAGCWLPEAMQFVEGHRAELARKPFGAFLACMTMSMNAGDYRMSVARWMEPVRTLVKPAHEGYFAGALDLSRIASRSERLKFRISVMLGAWKEGDHRDWNAIHYWAADLKLALNL